ncbi:endonuclease/exonuclease/phosphatase family protein [Haloferula sp. BvORR071]|uniref:endonuclease/exonuclease/phosphatase family protein n=1 Tax=Haloferula sp. BvORR071 TaxID=1396141 RepID=UPI002240F426|nr:endonuclease/exonuclease/phosphatase family protein [Haloferula sp. BvORR071]
MLTWNLEWFPGGRNGAPKEEQTRRIEEVRDQIRKLNPDILLLQEVNSQAVIEETLQPLGKEWRVAVVSRFMQGNFLSGQQLVIAAKIPADAAWSEPWQRGWAGAPRGYAYASFLVGKRRLGVYCLHLKSNLGNPPENTSKREDAIGQLIAHTESKDERLVKPDALLIGGDFNTDDPDTPAGQSPGERTFSFLRKAGFSWSFEGIEHRDRITCPGKGSYPAACFDYFWTKGLGRPLSSPKAAKASDHLPVVLEISL